MDRRIKTIDELTLMDDYMFAQVIAGYPASEAPSAVYSAGSHRKDRTH